MRRSQFANAAENERVEEIREGLAQYTGTVVTAASHAEAVASVLEQLAAAEQHETFLQQAYTTGVAYGILLDTASPDWRKRVRSDSDLGQMLMAALNVRPVANAVKVSARYGGTELRAAEQARAERRRAVMRELQNRFVDGPVLLVPAGGGATFNAVGATPIPGAGTVYFSSTAPRVSGARWRRRTAFDKRWQATAAWPVRIEGANITGDGWTVTVAPGWTVRPGPRSGDYQIIREPR